MRWAAALVLLLAPLAAPAHRASDAFLDLRLEGAQLSGHWAIALRDLALLAPLDADDDGLLRWGELRAAEAALRAAVAPALALRAGDAPCPLALGELLVEDRSDGRYGVFPLAGRCAGAPDVLTLDYALLFELDPGHRGLVSLRAGAVAHGAVLAPDRATVTLVVAGSGRWRLFADYLREGVHHIWIGLDHVLFLLALLLPGVLRRDAGGWQPQPRLRPVLLGVAGVVTAFTLAHSVTLSLAALGVLALPGALTESAIALSVLLAALNNVWPVVTRGRWAAALLFGLIHGFGFASVLAELGLPQGARLLALVAFNVGVELGQLAIVAVAVPAAFAARRWRAYPTWVLRGGSGAVAGLAACWLLVRTGAIA